MGKKREGSRDRFKASLKSSWSHLHDALEQLEASPVLRKWVEDELTLDRVKSLVFVLDTAKDWTFVTHRALEEPELAKRHRQAIEDGDSPPPVLLPMPPKLYPPSRHEKRIRALMEALSAKEKA
jgi:hypothetical protein